MFIFWKYFDKYVVQNFWSKWNVPWTRLILIYFIKVHVFYNFVFILSFSMLTTAFSVQLELDFSVLIFGTFSMTVLAWGSWQHSLIESNRFFTKLEFIVAAEEADGLRFPRTLDILRIFATNPWSISSSGTPKTASEAASFCFSSW